MTLPEETLEHVNEWVGFSHDLKKILGFGKTYDEACDMAEKNGEPLPVMFFVAEHLLKKEF